MTKNKTKDTRTLREAINPDKYAKDITYSTHLFDKEKY